MKDQIIQKLTSRKFWAAIIAVLTTVLTIAFNDVIEPQTVNMLKNMIFALCCYIGGESLVDAARNIFATIKTAEKTADKDGEE